MTPSSVSASALLACAGAVLIGHLAYGLGGARLAVRADQGGVDGRGAGGRAYLVGVRAVRAAVDGGARFLAPALGERAGVDGLIADRVEERGHGLFGGLVVPGDRQRAAVFG